MKKNITMFVTVIDDDTCEEIGRTAMSDNIIGCASDGILEELKRFVPGISDIIDDYITATYNDTYDGSDDNGDTNNGDME